MFAPGASGASGERGGAICYDALRAAGSPVDERASLAAAAAGSRAPTARAIPPGPSNLELYQSGVSD